MEIGTLYKIGIPIALVMAALWSFVFDKNKPSSKKEFIAKLVARALLFIVFLAVIVGVLSLALVDRPAS